MATTAEVIAAFLADLGVRRIYGVPGGDSTLDVIEACRQRKIEFLLTHHESSAALMAATEGELLGRPGTCLAASGAGVAGAIQGVAHAHLGREPVLLLTGRPSRASLRLAGRQGSDNLGLLEGVVKGSATLSASRVGRLLPWAWGKALALPHGPIHLDLPVDEALRPARRHAGLPEKEHPPRPSRSAIHGAARLLTERGRAIVIAGLGCRRPGVARALQELVEHLGGPLFTTPRAKGTIPEDHPLVAGTFFGGRLEEDLLSTADGIIAVGLDPVELLPRRWRTGLPVVSLTEYRTSPRPFEAACEVIADLPTSLGALRQALPPGGGWDLAEWAWKGSQFKLRSRSLLAEASEGRGKAGVPPHRVVEVTREIFPRQTVVTVDPGVHALVTAAFWDTYEPKGYLRSSGEGTMAYALPAAIAAKLLLPDRPVLAFLGDGGFLRSLADLATATRERLPLVVVVFVDGALGLSRVRQEQRRYAPAGVSLGAMDIPKMAEGLGALGTEVEDEQGLQSALKDALDTTQPAVIAVRVRSTGYRRLLEVLRGKSGG
jgi:acetolactate synthase-1/2/3 large subunit